MCPRPTILLGVCLLRLAPLEAAEPRVLAPESSITHVTVYGDRADVRRVAEGVQLQAGENLVEIAGLPALADPRSFRASGRGDNRVSIVNVDVTPSEERPVTPSGPQRLELEATESRIREAEARKMGVEAGRQFLDAARQSAPAGGGRLLEAGAATADQLRATLAFLTEEVERNRRSAVETDEELRRLHERVQEIRDAAKVRPAGEPTWDVRLELDAAAATEVDLVLEYTTSGASWSAAYDVVVPEDLGEIGIVYAANVRQRTGEDWDDVAITLSSAQPELGARLPALSPWWLAIPAVRPAAQAGAVHLDDQFLVRGGRSSVVRTVDSKETSQLRTIHTSEEAIAVPIRTAESLVDPSGTFTASFEVPTRQDLPSDGRIRRLRITSFDVEGRIRHESVPKHSRHAFLVASVRNASGFPLLAGPTRILLGGSFLGHGELGNVAPGREFQLALGVDQAVTLERKEVRRRNDESGSRRESAVDFRIEVTNHRTVPVTLTLRDQIPVSPDKDVSVRVRDVEPEPARDAGDDGLLEWTLEVPPGERRDATFGYTVKYPSDRKPRNL